MANSTPDSNGNAFRAPGTDHELHPPGSRAARRSPTLASSIAAAGWIAAAVCAAGVIAWSFIGVGLNPELLASKWQNGLAVMGQFIPPDRTILKQEWISTLITIQMAVVGTLLGAIVAFPVSFFAARTTSLVRILSSFIKTLLNIQRAIPVLVYALILTAMVGLGPPAGALAIGAGTFVMLTKLYAEALESLSPGPIEAVRAAGGNTPQVFVYGMLPQVFPNFVATTLYAFEINLQSSFILGFVGAGGIGYDLLNFTRLFQWKSVCTVLLITILVVNVIDFVSYRVRAALS